MFFYIILKIFSFLFLNTVSFATYLLLKNMLTITLIANLCSQSKWSAHAKFLISEYQCKPTKVIIFYNICSAEDRFYYHLLIFRNCFAFKFFWQLFSNISAKVVTISAPASSKLHSILSLPFSFKLLLSAWNKFCFLASSVFLSAF